MDSKPVISLGEIGVLGASSFVGKQLFEFATGYGASLIPFSRTPADRGNAYVWRGISASEFSGSQAIPSWISLCPVTALPDLLPMLELAGVRKLVAVSSTSLVTKKKIEQPSRAPLGGLARGGRTSRARLGCQSGSGSGFAAHDAHLRWIPRREHRRDDTVCPSLADVANFKTCYRNASTLACARPRDGMFESSCPSAFAQVLQPFRWRDSSLP